MIRTHALITPAATRTVTHPAEHGGTDLPRRGNGPDTPWRRFVAAAGLACMGLLTLATPAAAHVTVDGPPVAAGSYVKVVLRVPHGCAGSATRAVTVTVPPQLLAAKPAPKPGWQVVTERAPLSPPVQMHGRAVKETTSMVRWEGGHLPNEFFDEFSLMGKLAEGHVGPLAFKTHQTCDKGEVDWNGAPGSATPAPVLMVEPAQAPKGASAPGGHVH